MGLEKHLRPLMAQWNFAETVILCYFSQEMVSKPLPVKTGKQKTGGSAGTGGLGAI